ncbi:MAG: lytic transglycosylase domain-containing protein [Verrucomicrobiota bacterium]
MKSRVVLFLIVLVIADIALVRWWWENWRERRHEHAILVAAERYQVPPGLVKAVIWRESRFDAGALGGKQEIGLMQIRKAAAEDWAKAERIQGFQVEHLFDPGTNTLVGTWYLGKLLRRYQNTDNPLPYALADYNAGRTHVLRWNKGEAATNSAAFLQQMDFQGTKKYIEVISERYLYYQKKYPTRTAAVDQAPM